MANPPKKTGLKPAIHTPAVKTAAKSDAVALTAAQALKASDQAIGNSPTAKRAYVRKVPVAQPSVAAKPVSAPKSAVVAKVAAPVAKVEAASVAPAPASVIAPVVAKAVPAPAPVAVKPAPVAPEPKSTVPEIIVETKEEAAPEAVAPAIPTLAARAAEGTVKMSDVIENTKTYTDEAKVRFQSAFSDISAKAKAATEKSSKAVEEISDLTKGNVEALVESGKIAAKGLETFGQDAAEYGRLSFEKATATMKNLAAVKSPTEFFQLQSELLSATFDGFAKEAAKNSEAFLKLAGDVAQPLSSRVAVVTEKVKSLAA